MSQILGKASNAKQPKAIGSLGIQGSQRGGVIPLIYGTNKISPNLLDYDDFKSVPGSSGGGGKGKGGGKGSSDTKTSTTYSASVLWGLVQGPIGGIGQIWENNAVFDQSQTTITVHLGTDGQAADTYWLDNHASKALTYSGTAYLGSSNLPLGTSASLPAVSIEIQSSFVGAGSGGYDAHPNEIVEDFLTNPRYGANFPLANLDSLTPYRDYCSTLLIGLSPILGEQREALGHLDDITKLTNSAIVWSGALLKIIPYGDSAVASSSVWHILFHGGDLTGGTSMFITLTDSSVAGSPATSTTPCEQDDKLSEYVNRFVADLVAIAPPFAIVVSSVTSAVSIPTNFTDVTVTLIQQPSLGTTTITVGQTTSPVPGATITVNQTASPNGTGYNPNTTPVYDLIDSDFIVGTSGAGSGSLSMGGPATRSGAGIVAPGDDPIHVERISPADVINNIKVEWRDRGNRYNTEIAEEWDQASIDDIGIRNATPFKAGAVCDPAVASICARLALNRALLYRNQYTFRLGWRYCLLEPMDLVTITERRLGLVQQEVRITSIAEDAEGTLTITAEDFVLGYSSTPLYPRQIGQGYQPNWNAPAGSVNAPVIFEPPAALAAFQVWIGISAGPGVGTIQAYMSSDGSSYALLPGGTLQQAITGTLTSPLPSGAAVDVTNTLAVNLTESRGVLNSVSSSDATSGVTTSWVGDPDGTGGELISYQTATLTSTSTYNLTTLYRGVSSSPIAAHATGSRFLFVDASTAVGKFDYPAAWVGQTIYFKFLTSNITGGGVQSLADVTAYPYTLTGGVDTAQPLLIEFYSGDGLTTTSQILNVFVAPMALQSAANFGSIAGAVTVGRAAVAAATPEDFAIQKALAATPNTWTQIGNMHFNAGAVTPSFTTTGGTAQSLALGDSLRIVGTTTPDATLAGVVAILAWSY